MEASTVAEVVREIKRRAAQRSDPLLVALDGRSGAGKSTVAKEIARAVGAIVIDGDDFYSGGTFAEWTKRSPAEKAAWCIDWRRLRTEALEPFLAGRAAAWHPFNSETLGGLSPSTISRSPAAVVILDGAYSTRPELADLIDISVLVRLPDATRRERLKKREAESFLEEWHSVWDESEDYYFTHVRHRSSFDVVLNRT